MLLSCRKFTVFMALVFGSTVLAVAAHADIGKKLIRDAGRNQDIRQQLISVGVLDASSEIVPSQHVKDAVSLFIRTYFDRPPESEAKLAERLRDISQNFNSFTGLETSDYSNKIEIQIPSKLLSKLRDLTPGIETLHVSGEGQEALKVGTYRYTLRAHTPQSLLREIFYSNPNLVIETLQSDETQFVVSGHVRNDKGIIDHHFLRKAFQVGGSTTAVYMKYDHRAPDTFSAPAFLEPLLKLTVPPRELFAIQDTDERLTKLVGWADEVYSTVLDHRHPPSSVTAIRRFLTKTKQRTDEWRKDQLDDYKRQIFDVAVLEQPEEREAGWERWRKDTAWRFVVGAAVNIASSRFDTHNGWRNIEVSKCFASRKPKDGERYRQVRIVFATNRARGLELESKSIRGERFNIKRLFKNETDANDQLHYGCVYVTVPSDWEAERQRETHVYEDWGWREKVRETDYNKYYSIQRYAYLGNSGANPRGERVRLVDRERWLTKREDTALLYVHGYNTAFHESLLRIAQIAAASQYPGRIYLFSWPSARAVTSYVADMDASEKSDPYLAAFVRSILLDSKIRKLDVLAHSMGGQVFLRAFSRFRSSFDQTKKVRFGKVIFAAPDVSQTVFKEKINDIRPYTSSDGGVSVYASSLDRVLLVSSFLRGGKPRAGDLSRDTILDTETVTVIDATRPSWWCDPSEYSVLGHSYFSNNDEVLNDIIHRLTPQRLRKKGEDYRYTNNQPCWYSRKNKKDVASQN